MKLFLAVFVPLSVLSLPVAFVVGVGQFTFLLGVAFLVAFFLSLEEGKPKIKLAYVGKQSFPGHEPIRLWNILCEGHPRHRSTVSLVTLSQLGVVRKKYAKSLFSLSKGVRRA